MSDVDLAARFDDPIEHSHALECLIAGLIVGAVVGAAIAASGGLALGPILVAGATSASFGGMIGQLGGSLWPKSAAGHITSGAATVFIGSKAAARAIVDTVDCDAGEHIAQGSKTVSIEQNPAARKGDKTTCDGTIEDGCPTVWIGNEQATYLEIHGEVPLWLELTVMALGLLGGVGEIALASRGLRLVMATRLGAGLVTGTIGAYGGNWLGGLIFGEGSAGQRVTGFLGGLLGGVLGSHAVRRPAIAGAQSSAARGWQGKGDYPGVDAFHNGTLKPGTRVYAGLDRNGNPSGFFIPEESYLASGGNKVRLWEGLQVQENAKYGYRDRLGVFEVTRDTPVAFGNQTVANPQFGSGGLPQIYTTEFGPGSGLVKVGEVPLH